MDEIKARWLDQGCPHVHYRVVDLPERGVTAGTGVFAADDEDAAIAQDAAGKEFARRGACSGSRPGAVCVVAVPVGAIAQPLVGG